MNNSYLFEKETRPSPTATWGHPILVRLGAFMLFTLAVLGLAGCEGLGGSDSPSMTITPPSSEDGPDLDVVNGDVDPPYVVTRGYAVPPGMQFTMNYTVENIGNKPAPQTTLNFKMGRDPNPGSNPVGSVPSLPTIGRASVESLDPSESSSRKSHSVTAPSTPGTYIFGACVDPVSSEVNSANNCDGSSFTVGSSGGGGSPGGGGATEAVWPCPFGDIEDMRVVSSRYGVSYQARVRFVGNTCGNYFISAAGAGSPAYHDVGIGQVFFWNEDNGLGKQPSIEFDNFNSSGRTVVRQYTIYFCNKRDVEFNDSAFCYDGTESFTSTLTVRWLSW